MRAMSTWLIAIAFTQGAMVSALASQRASPQDAQPCRIEAHLLNCSADGHDGKALLAALASPETQTMLAGKLKELPLFASAGEREQFRRSLERVWRRAVRHARRQTRLYRRRRMSDEDYRLVQKDFARAEKAYHSAIELYRNHIWHQKDTGS